MVGLFSRIRTSLGARILGGLVTAGTFANHVSASEEVIPGVHLGLPLPPPPGVRVTANSQNFRFNPTKSPAENARTKAMILRNLEQWTRRLDEIDLHTAAQSEVGGASRRPPTANSRLLLSDRPAVAKNLLAWSHYLSAFQLFSQCGLTDRTQDVERYDGSLGPSRQFVSTRQPAVGQIQWNENLNLHLNHPDEDAGNVSGYRWCSGTLIDDTHFLTAGHCFEPDINGFRTPIGRGSSTISHKLAPAELALFMHVNFNYQINGTTGEVRPPVVYPVVKLVEFELGKTDYAIVELGMGADGTAAGQRFGHALPDTSQGTLRSATLLTLIQHPEGKPKRIAAGSKLSIGATTISYGDIDTADASSGAGILDQSGHLIGVHTDPGCTTIGMGANSGVALSAIAKYSAMIH
jgi:hypothetical protein